MNYLTEEERIEKKKLYYRDYFRNRRATLKTKEGVSYIDWKQRCNVDYREREKLRKKTSYENLKYFRILKKEMPYYFNL